jgi:MFS family permease
MGVGFSVVSAARASNQTPSIDATDDRGLSAEQLRQGLLLLAITTFAATFALNAAQALAPNFFRDEIGMDGAQNGYLIAIREVPGFLLIFVAAILLRLGMARATALSLLIMGIGYSLYASANSFPSLIVPTLIGSIGFHSWLQLQDALGLSLAKPGEEGSVLGRFRGIGFAGSLVALIVVLAVVAGVEWRTGNLLANQGPWLRGLLIMTGVVAVIGAIVIVRFPVAENLRAAARVAPAITFRKEYGLYYWLSFLDGSRMQIYFAFAPFVLVEQFGVNARALTTLLLVSSLINWRAGAYVGRMVDRFGEKRMLTIGYTMHLLVFLGFAFSRNIWLLYLTYLGYNFLFLFSIGTTTYLRKIARREDLAPSLAMGVSLAHATAVVVPIIGAALWEQLGYQFPFLFGTIFIFISLWLTQKIDVARQRVPGSPAPAGLAHEAEREIETELPSLPLEEDGRIGDSGAIAAADADRRSSRHARAEGPDG